MFHPGRSAAATLAGWLLVLLLGVCSRNGLAQLPPSGWLASAPRPGLIVTPVEVARAKEIISCQSWARSVFANLTNSAQQTAAAGYANLASLPDSDAHIAKASGILNCAVAGLLGDRTDLIQSAAQGLVAYASYYSSLPPPANVEYGRIDVSTLQEARWYLPLVTVYDIVVGQGALNSQQQLIVEQGLLRPAIQCFMVTDYVNDPRMRSVKWTCSNWQAYHVAAVGLTGLTLRDESLVTWAVNSRFGFLHLIGHDTREDGLWWERSVDYHHFALSALLAFSEALARCGVDLYHVGVDPIAGPIGTCNYSTDTGTAPKYVRGMFEGPPFALYQDASYLALGDNALSDLQSSWMSMYWVGLRRYALPQTAWLLKQFGVLDPANPDGTRLGFYHDTKYAYRYANVRLNGSRVSWKRADTGFLVNADGSVTANITNALSGATVYLLAEQPAADYTFEWDMTRLVDYGSSDHTYLAMKAGRFVDSSRLFWYIPSSKMPVGTVCHYKVVMQGGISQFYKDGVLLASGKGNVKSAIPTWPQLLTMATTTDTDLLNFRSLAAQYQPGSATSFAGDGVHENGSSLFPATGLAVLREGGGDYTSDETTTTACLDAGPHGGSHGHSVKLNTTLWSGARNWIPAFKHMDYSSVESVTWGDQTLAHNSLLIDQVSQEPIGTSANYADDNDSIAAPVFAKITAFDAVNKKAVGETRLAYPGWLMRRTEQLVRHQVVDNFTAQPDILGANHTFDYVLHVEGALAGSSYVLQAASGQMGTNCGYQFVTKLNTAAVTGPGWVRYTCGSRSLRLWIVPTEPCQIILANGPSESTTRLVPMLITRATAPSAAFVTVLDEGEQLTGVSLSGNTLTLTYADGTANVTVDRMPGAPAQVQHLSLK